MTSLELSAKTAGYSVTPAPLGKPGGPGLWRHKGWKLPNYVENVARGIMKTGKSRSHAIQIAIGVLRNWANGGGDVTPEVRAAAAKALAQWEQLKARAKGSKTMATTTTASRVELGWTESMHPRVGAGATGGGQFTTGSGGGAGGGSSVTNNPAQDAEAKALWAKLQAMPPAQRQAFLAGLSPDQLQHMEQFSGIAGIDAGLIAQVTAAHAKAKTPKKGKKKAGDKKKSSGSKSSGSSKKSSGSSGSSKKSSGSSGSSKKSSGSSGSSGSSKSSGSSGSSSSKPKPAPKPAPKPPVIKPGPIKAPPPPKPPDKTTTYKRLGGGTVTIKNKDRKSVGITPKQAAARRKLSRPVGLSLPATLLGARVLDLAFSPSPATRKTMAAQGTALPDGSYPVPDVAHLRAAIQAFGRCPQDKRVALVAHIRRRARALGVAGQDWVTSFLADHVGGSLKDQPAAS